MHAPYDRPPLSKQVLAGHWDVDRLALTVGVDGGIDALDLDWRLGTLATGLDLDARQVVLADGERLGFDGLVIATGATPRRLPGSEGLAGVHTLRTLDDCLAVRAELDAGARRLVVVGAGFIGAEVAATCRTRGLDVTMVEALPVPLGQALGEEMGAVLADLHRDHGVDVRLGTAVAGLDGGDDGRVERVRLADGSAIEADLVVVGIGVVPNTGWLEGSGLTLDDGVVCDATTLAAPGVVAAGDVARWPSRRFGELMRVEHWDNAIAMGAHAARRLLAGRRRARRRPGHPARALRPGALVLVGPVRPQDPARRPIGRRRRGAGRRRVHRRAPLRRPLPPRRPGGRGAGDEPPPPAARLPAAHRAGRQLGRGTGGPGPARAEAIACVSRSKGTHDLRIASARLAVRYCLASTPATGTARHQATASLMGSSPRGP